MKSLVEELSDQHYRLLQSIVDIEHQYTEERFEDLRAQVMAHLEHEDKLLYPHLPPELRLTHIRFLGHIKEFYAWWPTPESRKDPEFQMSLLTLLDALRERARFEEFQVFPLHR